MTATNANELNAASATLASSLPEVEAMVNTANATVKDKSLTKVGAGLRIAAFTLFFVAVLFCIIFSCQYALTYLVAMELSAVLTALGQAAICAVMFVTLVVTQTTYFKAVIGVLGRVKAKIKAA